MFVHDGFIFFFCLCCQPEPPSVLSFICLNTKRLLTAFQLNNSNTNCALTENKSPDCWYQTHRSKFVTLSRPWVVLSWWFRLQNVPGAPVSWALERLLMAYSCTSAAQKWSRAKQPVISVQLVYFLEYLIFFLFCLFARWKQCFILGVGRSVRVVSQQHGRFMNEGSFTIKSEFQASDCNLVFLLIICAHI